MEILKFENQFKTNKIADYGFEITRSIPQLI